MVWVLDGSAEHSSITTSLLYPGYSRAQQTMRLKPTRIVQPMLSYVSPVDEVSILYVWEIRPRGPRHGPSQKHPAADMIVVVDR